MRYSVLGPLEVEDDEGPINLGPPKQRAVLALLLIEAGRVVSVDTLIDRLWGDDAPSSAQGTLQAYISNLRKVLEPARRSGEMPKALVSQPPGYVLNVDRHSLDAARFEELAGRGAELLAHGRPADAADVLDEALRLWRGTPYADLAYEPFAQHEIARLEELRLHALEDKTAAQLALGRHASLIGELRRLIDEHPLRERLRAQLALALYRDARQGDALAALRDAREHLADELGVDPGPELRDLEERILRQDPGLHRRPEPDEIERLDAPEKTSVVIGRDTEFEVLGRAARSAVSGRGRVVLVAGDPGIGKTTLLEEFAAATDAPSAYWGHCYEAEVAPPFWPWRQILDALLEERGPEAFVDALGTRIEDIVQLLPQLARHANQDEQRASPDPEEARFRLYTAVLSLLGHIARKNPLMLVLEDIHWGDTATLRLLNFAATELRHARFLVVATYRDIGVGPDDELGLAIAALARLAPVQRIMLRGLTRDEVGEYITASGDTLSSEAIDELHVRTGGNPFFLTELQRLLTSYDGDDLDALDHVPVNVRDVILQRVSSLPEGTRRVMEGAAVIGRHFDVSTLAAVENSTQGDVLDALAPAVLSRLLVDVDPNAGDYRFSHALVRDALYNQLAPATRARLHLGCAEVIERGHAGDPTHSAEIASHYQQAAVLGVTDKAVRSARVAGDHAMAQLAYEDAEKQYRAGLQMLERMPAGTERDSLELALQHGLVYVLMSTRGYSAPQIGPSMERIRSLSAGLAPRQSAAALAASVMFHATIPQMDDALPLTDELLELAAESEDPSVMWLAHMSRGRCCWQTAAFREAGHHLTIALELAESVDAAYVAAMLPEQDAETYSCILLSGVTWFLGDNVEADRVAQRGLGRARQVGHPLSIVAALGMVMVNGAFNDRPERVEIAVQEQAEICRRNGYRFFEASGAMVRGWVVARQGNPQAGLAQMVDAIGTIAASGSHLVTGLFLPLLVSTQLVAGAPEDALSSVDEGLAASARNGQRFHDAELHRLRGEALARLALERRDEIEAALRAALDIARIQGAVAYERRALDSLDRLNVGVGRTDR
jgi:DNA-binding SARP family transcriptional activator